MAKSANKMEKTSEIWSFLAILVGAAVLYGGYRYMQSHRQRKSHRGSVCGLPDMDRLKRECWDQYVTVETLRNFKAKCAKAITGETGVLAANRQLTLILNGDNTSEYKAPRIIGQVCDFIINMATANGMLSHDGRIIMPAGKPKLMDKEAFFSNIHVSEEYQCEKYKAVIKYERDEYSRESENMKFPNLLSALLPSLEIITSISNNEDNLSSEDVVKKANFYLKISTEILKQYGY